MTVTNVICETACTVALQIESPPFSLTTLEAGEITAAILLVWATGFAFRMAIKALRTDEVGPSDGSDA